MILTDVRPSTGYHNSQDCFFIIARLATGGPFEPARSKSSHVNSGLCQQRYKVWKYFQAITNMTPMITTFNSLQLLRLLSSRFYFFLAAHRFISQNQTRFPLRTFCHKPCSVSPCFDRYLEFAFSLHQPRVCFYQTPQVWFGQAQQVGVCRAARRGISLCWALAYKVVALDEYQQQSCSLWQQNNMLNQSLRP